MLIPFAVPFRKPGGPLRCGLFVADLSLAKEWQEDRQWIDEA